MARKSKEQLETLDDDLGPVNGPPEQQQPILDQTTAIDANTAFAEAAESAVLGDWKTRRDAWDHTVYNPEFHLGEDRRNADGSFRARRAPSGGSAGGASVGRRVQGSKARPLPVSTVEMFLLSSHAMLAGAFEIPELKLDKDDANNLAVPICKVADLYELKVDPRLEAYGMLMIALIGVYGPKFGAFMERMKAERARNVTPRPNPPPGPSGIGANVSVLKPVPVEPGSPAKDDGKAPPPMKPDDLNKLFGDV